MSSRDLILSTIKKNQPAASALPVIENFIPFAGDNISKFKEVLTAIGVDENGSVWVTEDIIVERAIPFICENLVVLVDRNNFLPTMHHAYDYIADKDYGFSTFIAGPSKTADIEQSLVLGAHGPKTMTVFLT